MALKMTIFVDHDCRGCCLIPTYSRTWLNLGGGSGVFYYKVCYLERLQITQIIVKTLDIALLNSLSLFNQTTQKS